MLIFTSAPLTSPLALVGTLSATLFFSTNVTDTDLVVKLIDVYPAGSPSPVKGESVLVSDGIIRTMWRDYPKTTLPHLLSGNPTDGYTATLSLWDTAYVFNAGHSIRVHVSSSNYPRFFPNPVSPPARAPPPPPRARGAFTLTPPAPPPLLQNTAAPMSNISALGNITAGTTIYFDASRPSAISLPVVPLSALPEFPVLDAVESMVRAPAGGAP